MLVRIKGIVEEIKFADGISKSTNKPWAKKTYVIRDNMYKKDEYNTVVYVQDFGKLNPNSAGHEFDFKSNHIVGETVDLACYLETNEQGFTNVNYGKPFEDIEVRSTSEEQGTKAPVASDPEEVETPVQNEMDNNTELPF